MTDILTQLFRGEYTVLERPVIPGSPYAEAQAVAREAERALIAKLPEELHDLMDAYDSATGRLARVAGEQDFAAGFSLGVRLIIAALEER